MKVKAKWIKIENRYGPQTNRLVVGKIAFGSWEWNPLKSKGDVGKDYRTTTYLPGFKDVAKHHVVATEDEAACIVERQAESWLKSALGMEVELEKEI